MAEQQRFEIEVPDEFNSRERKMLAREIIEFMKERTQSGKSVVNRPFPGYSKSYNKFGQTVDLTVEGKMLKAIKLLDHDTGVLEIGFEPGEQNDKAEGNQLGTYGQSTPIPGKRRRFLGISKKDLNSIVRGFSARAS